MLDYKQLRNELKQNYTQEGVASALMFLGCEINRNYKFKLRDENTPSASISKSGLITDFGTGWSGDIVAVLFEYKNIPLSEASIYIANLMNIDIKRFSNE